MIMESLFPTITFVAVSLIGVLSYLFYESKQKRRWIVERLRPPGIGARGADSINVFQRMLLGLGARTAPSGERELTKIKRELSYAGYRKPSAPHVYFGIRTFLALGMAAVSMSLVAIFGSLNIRSLLLIVLPTAIGYYLPQMVLRSKIKNRKKKIFRELPDTLDLLVICTEAGLGFEMALFRVSKELKDVAPVLSKEFAQYFFETRGGVARNRALLNLVDRNDSPGLRSVVEVVIQSMKYGADVAEALRIHSEAMRTERRQIAEEKGAKIGVKLTLPMVLLVLPALLIIVLGPAILKMAGYFSG